MKSRMQFLIVLFLFSVLATFTLEVGAQTSEVLTTGLTFPNKVILAGERSLFVAEAGTPTPNTGRISLINRNTGKRKTVIHGLPSGVNNLGGPSLPSGPSGIVLNGRTLYVTIPIGDGARNVGPGLELPNFSPSSPLFCSVLSLTLPKDFENLRGEFALSIRDQDNLANGRSVTLLNSAGQKLSLRMVINLPNFRNEPRPNAPQNIRHSNLYGIEYFKQQLFIADASQNRITRVNTDGSGHIVAFAKFKSKENPMFPTIGGPVVEPVPDNIRRVGSDVLLVPLLTGFPFIENMAEIRSVNLTTGKHEVFIGVLTSAIDVMRTDEGYFTLEFSANQLEGEPGRLKFYSSVDADPVTVVSDLISPTSMVHDSKSGAIFITNIFPGMITRVTSLP